MAGYFCAANTIALVPSCGFWPAITAATFSSGHEWLLSWGSLGKTTTKRALDAALNCPDRGFSFSNYGSSLSENVLRVRRSDTHAVIEAGIQGPGHMTSYRRTLQPDLVVVTSIASEHNRSFPTLFDTRAEKVKMVSGLPPEGVAILNGDDPHVRWMATQTRARVLTYGVNPDNDVRASNLSVHDGVTTFQVHMEGKCFDFESKLQGEHLVYPILAAVTAVHVEKLDLGVALARLAQLAPTNSRMELINLPDGTRILDDSYKAALESLHAAFETFSRFSGRRIVVLGNVEEPPGKQGDVYRDLGRRLAGFADLVICIGGDHMSKLRSGAVQAGMNSSAIRLTGSRIDEAMAILKAVVQPGDAVLVKGASTQRLRRIVLALAGKSVRCRIKYCGVKVSACDACPLLNGSEAALKNHFISRYIEP